MAVSGGTAAAPVCHTTNQPQARVISRIRSIMSPVRLMWIPVPNTEWNKPSLLQIKRVSEQYRQVSVSGVFYITGTGITAGC